VAIGVNTLAIGVNTPAIGVNTPAIGVNTPAIGVNTLDGNIEGGNMSSVLAGSPERKPIPVSR
jgi:tRNA A37 threonylcarbamoyladenosine modification protein TsaB